MKVYSIKCPDCNAALEIEEGREYCFCNYCGAKIFLDDERTKRIRITDDAKIREAEVKEKIEIERMHHKERGTRNSLIMCAVLMLVIFIGALLLAKFAY